MQTQTNALIGKHTDFIFSVADQMRHNEKPITIYSATIPSSTANIDEVSYVVADTAGVKAMMDIMMKGGDVSGGVSASSISGLLLSSTGG